MTKNSHICIIIVLCFLSQLQKNIVAATEAKEASKKEAEAGNVDAEGGKASLKVPVTLRDYFFHDPFFQDSWPTFDCLFQNFLIDYQLFWPKATHTKVESCEQKKSAESGIFGQNPETESCDQKSGEAKSQKDCPKLGVTFPRRWMLPKLLSKVEMDKLLPLDLKHHHLHDHLVNVKDDEEKLEISLDMHEYRPDEIKVHVTGNMLKVEAKHEEKEEDGRYMSRQYRRQYELPDGCDAGTVHSSLSSDGIMVISAPRRMLTGLF